MKKRILIELVFVVAAILLMLIIAVARGTARAVEPEEPVTLGYLLIRAREPEPEKPVHDKRTAVKAPERVEIVEEEIPSQPAAEEAVPEEVRTYLGSFKITGYDICVSCCGNTNGVTASGTTATVGRTCAAGKDIPFGTVLYIDGIGYRTVEDRGGGVNGGHIDVLCSDHPECYSITGQYDVYVVEEVQECSET